MITLIELEERVRLLTEENINLRKQVLDYAKKINKQKCVMKKLKEWLEECIYDIKEDDAYDRTSYQQGLITSLECTLAKVEELESGKNENVDKTK